MFRKDQVSINKLLLCGISYMAAFTIIYIIYYLYSFAPFGIGTLACDDGNIQYLDFFAYFRDVLLGTNSLNYTFSDTLGGDTLSVFSYYLASPFNLLVLLFEKDQLLTFFNLLVALKVSMSAFTMTFFLKERFGKSLSNVLTVLLALSYAFMQYNIAQSSNIIWLDAVYMLPLMILGVYKVVNKKKIGLLVITTSLCIVFNWYAAGICCLFSIIWFFYEACLVFFKDGEYEISERFGEFFIEIICYGSAMFIAVLLSASFFLPTIYSMLGGKGLSNDMSLSFSGNVLSLIKNYHIGAVSTKGNPSLYCGSVTLIGCMGFFVNSTKSKRYKWITGILLFMCIGIYFWEPLNFLFSLFRRVDSYWYRYSFVSIFPIVYIAASFYGSDNRKTKYTVGCSVLFSLILILLNYGTSEIDMKYIYYTSAVVVFMAMLGRLKEVVKIKKYKQFISCLTVGLLILELGINAKNLWVTEYSDFESSTIAYQENHEKQIAELQNYDTDMYRISQTTYRRGASFNESLAYNYWSNTGYTSCPENIQLNFLDKLGYRNEGECITVAKTTVLAADSLLGVKYVLTDNPVNGLLECKGLNEYNGKKIYENPYSLPMAFLIDSYEEKNTAKLNPFEYHEELYSQLLDEDVTLYTQVDHEYSVNQGNVIYKLKLPKGNYAVYGNIPFDSYSEATLDINGNSDLMYGGWLSQSVFYIPVNEGDIYAKVSLITDDMENFDEPQFYALNLDSLKAVTDRISSQNITDIELGNDKIAYEIEVDSDKYLYLSVPYSAGWEVKVNDKVITPILLGECMMIIPLTLGNNSIEMNYRIPGLHMGICITVIGIIILLAWMFFEKNSKFTQWLCGLITSRAMRYIVVGGCTTMVNLVVFAFLCKVVDVNINLSNIISIICAIVFAYIANKTVVFGTKCSNIRELILEMIKFMGARLSTMVIEVGGVFLLYNIIHQDELVAKLETQIIVLVINYFISKFLVFNKREEK